jgi:hypothetical protein
MVIRLLGAFAPNTFAGMIVGPNKTELVAAAAELFRNCRRVSTFAFLVPRLFRDSCLPFSMQKAMTLVFNLWGIIVPNLLEVRKANLLASERYLLYPWLEDIKQLSKYQVRRKHR